MNGPCQLLVELANVERGQGNVPVVEAVRIQTSGIEVTLAAGPTVSVPRGADRDRIVALLAATGTPVAPACPDSDRYPDDLTVAAQWCELLDDVGSWYDAFARINPQLRLLTIERNGSRASLTVTDGKRVKNVAVPLDGEFAPAGVNAEIAASF